jgi:hypothetical protein
MLCGGRSVGIVRLRTKSHGVCSFLFLFLLEIFYMSLGIVESFCECGNEPTGCIKRSETIEWLQNLGTIEQRSSAQNN